MKKGFILMVFLALFATIFAFTPQDDINLRNYYAIWNGTSITANNFTGTFIGNLTGSLTIGTNVNYFGFDLFNATNVNATALYQNTNIVLDISNAATCGIGNFSVFNGSDFTCDEPGSSSGDITAVNTPDKYLTGGATTGAVTLLINETEFNLTYLNTDDEGNLNVNSSNYWDTLNTVDDIALNWTQLQNYPSACPANTFVTQVDDTITCTAISDVYLSNTGDTATGNYTFDTTTLFIDSTNNRIGIGTITPSKVLHVIGDSRFEGDVNITGTMQLGSALTVATNGNFEGNVVIDGNLTVLGDQINASVTNQYLNGTFRPALNNQFDIGTSLFNWKDGYFAGTLYAGTLSGNIDAVNITSGTIASARIADDYLLNNGDTGTGNYIFTGGTVDVDTLNTGQGDNELYGMDQNVLTTSSPTFVAISANLNGSQVNTGTISNSYIQDSYVLNTGDSMTGSLNMTNNTITNIDCITFESGGQICTG